MKTNRATPAAARVGRVYYDAECPVCRTGASIGGRIFSRRNFEWLPLQAAGGSTDLKLSEAALREEMKLQLNDGRVVGGIDSWAVLLRSVWWLWPLGAALSLPGLRSLGQACYRWFARHRYCFGGQCRLPTKKRASRTIPFLDLP